MNFILNRAATKSVVNKTPYEAWYGKPPPIHLFHVFGCVAHVKDVRPNLKKLDDRSTPMVFVGYEPSSKAYRVFNLASNRVVITRDVIFDESTRWDWSGEGDDLYRNGSEPFTVELLTEATGARDLILP